MSKLISEPPLLVLRSLAVAHGLNEAIVLQQVHFLGQLHQDGWVQKSLADWTVGREGVRGVFPFWSSSTLERTLANLVTARVLIREEVAGKPSRYRVDYTHLTLTSPTVNVTSPPPQSEEGSSTTSKETTKKGNKKTRAGAQILSEHDEPVGFSQWLGYHNKVTGRSVPKAGTKTRSDLAREFGKLVAQGYSLDDFKSVTDYGQLDPYWADKDLSIAWHLRQGEFGERAETGRRLVAAGPPSQARGSGPGGRQSAGDLLSEIGARNGVA